MCAQPLLERLEALSQGLLFPSESDYPFEPVSWGPTEPTPEAIAKILGLSPDTPIETLELRELFEPFLEIDENASEEEKDEARRYRALVRLFEDELEDARVLRVGKVDIDVYVLGRDPKGQWIGLKTHVVET